MQPRGGHHRVAQTSSFFAACPKCSPVTCSRIARPVATRSPLCGAPLRSDCSKPPLPAKPHFKENVPKHASGDTIWEFCRGTFQRLPLKSLDRCGECSSLGLARFLRNDVALEIQICFLYNEKGEHARTSMECAIARVCLCVCGCFSHRAVNYPAACYDDGGSRTTPRMRAYAVVCVFLCFSMCVFVIAVFRRRSGRVCTRAFGVCVCI